MIVDRQFHNIKCDACGRLIDDETWWDDKDALTTQILDDCNWIECEGRHYCDECWEYDDDDNIVTKDGASGRTSIIRKSDHNTKRI